MQIHSDNLNIHQIADSGQCFRMKQIGDNTYSLIAYDRYLEITQEKEDLIKLSCSEEEYKQFWEEYFDMNYDYGKIVTMLIGGKDQFLKEAAEYGRGIRILKQEFFEMMITFIISQNKNIPAIKSCIEALCKRYGTPRTSEGNGAKVYYTFPTPQVLALADREELRELKVGYRDEYIISASRAITQGVINMDFIKSCSYEEAIKALKEIHGIGDKVANCICLYGLHHINVLPIDVWIKRVLEEVYHGEFRQDLYEGYAGIIQQYMFYYMRHVKELK